MYIFRWAAAVPENGRRTGICLCTFLVSGSLARGQLDFCESGGGLHGAAQIFENGSGISISHPEKREKTGLRSTLDFCLCDPGLAVFPGKYHVRRNLYSDPSL